MNQYLKAIGLRLAGRIIDFGAAALTTSSPKSHTEQRLEQIDKTLKALESVPEVEVGQHPARPPTAALESQNPRDLTPAATITTQSAPEKEDIAIACVPCALGHFSTSAGLLNEAIRFEKEGITSNEVLDRIAKMLEEQNTLERVDLTQEKIRGTPEWERELAEEALQQSRSLRHRIETLTTIKELKEAAADTEGYYRNLNRRWWKLRLTQTGKTEPKMNPQGGEKPYYYDPGKDAFVCKICGGVYGYEPGTIDTQTKGKPYYEKGILTHLREDHGFIIKESPTGGEPLEIKPPKKSNPMLELSPEVLKAKGR